MQPPPSWLHVLRRMTRQVQRWRRRLARSAKADGQDTLHELFLLDRTANRASRIDYAWVEIVAQLHAGDTASSTEIRSRIGA